MTHLYGGIQVYQICDALYSWKTNESQRLLQVKYSRMKFNKGQCKKLTMVLNTQPHNQRGRKSGDIERKDTGNLVKWQGYWAEIL